MESEIKPTPTPIEKPKLAASTSGLEAEHLDQAPILDSYAFQAHGKVQGSRTYKDGTHYRLFKDHRDQQTTGVEPAWKKFVTVNPQGIQAIESVIRDQVLNYEQPSREGLPSTGAGHIIWVVYLENEERVIETSSGSYNALPPWVRALDEAVTQNLVPRSAQ
jgi:hypothetical protein